MYQIGSLYIPHSNSEAVVEVGEIANKWLRRTDARLLSGAILSAVGMTHARKRPVIPANSRTVFYLADPEKTNPSTEDIMWVDVAASGFYNGRGNFLIGINVNSLECDEIGRDVSHELQHCRNLTAASRMERYSLEAFRNGMIHPSDCYGLFTTSRLWLEGLGEFAEDDNASPTVDIGTLGDFGEKIGQIARHGRRDMERYFWENVMGDIETNGESVGMVLLQLIGMSYENGAMNGRLVSDLRVGKEVKVRLSRNAYEKTYGLVDISGPAEFPNICEKALTNLGLWGNSTAWIGRLGDVANSVPL